MYSTHNEGTSAVAERFIRTLNDKIYNHMTAILKNLYISRLDEVVDKGNKTDHQIIKMNYINRGEEYNRKKAKFKVGDHVRTSKCKNIFGRGYTSIWSKEIFVMKKIKNCCPIQIRC